MRPVKSTLLFFYPQAMGAATKREWSFKMVDYEHQGGSMCIFYIQSVGVIDEADDSATRGSKK